MAIFKRNHLFQGPSFWESMLVFGGVNREKIGPKKSSFSFLSLFSTPSNLNMIPFPRNTYLCCRGPFLGAMLVLQ